MTLRMMRGAALVAMLVATTSSSNVIAGPLLVCHSYDIGDARSLPWHESNGWSGERTDYRLQHLVADTDALLTPSAPIVVRMETLRRAAIYASHDRQVATQLLDRMHARLASAREQKQPDPIALLDTAYLAATFRQIALLRDYETEWREPGANVAPLAGLDEAPQLIEQAIAQKPDDAALEFAAALIASAYNTAAYDRHAKEARMAMAGDALVARNIALLH